MNTLELVQITSPQINGAGARYYFDEQTVAAGKADLGLDGFRFYVLGRGGVLGDCEAEVVQSAFGYFHIDLVRKMWDSGRQRCAPRDAARAYLACADEYGRRHLSDVAGLDEFNAAAEAVTGAVHADALPLFAGVAAEPLPDDTPARAYRNAVVLRELRGSVHLVAIVASGLAPAIAHAIRRPNDVATFGYPDVPLTTDADRAALDRADTLTDALMVPMFEVLDEAGREAFAAGAAAIAAALD